MNRAVSLLQRGGLVFLVLLVAASPAAFIASADPQPVFLPFLVQSYSPPPPPSSFDLITAAEEAGEIDAETAMLYKTYAVFGDRRLPAAYRSTHVGGEASLFMVEVQEAFSTLSQQAQQALLPFFIPPYLPGSWIAQDVEAQAAPAPSDWAYLPAAGGKARVWYIKSDPEMKRKAGVIAAALTNDIWPKEVAVMGQSPIPDDAGFQNVVLYHKYRENWDGAWVPLAAGVAVAKQCTESPAVIYINPNYPDRAPPGSKGELGLVEITAHEFMHALQFAYPLADHCSLYFWLAEATATWAEDFVYPDHDSEWAFAQRFLNQTNEPLYLRHEYRDYGLYLLPFYYTHKYGDNQAIGQVWRNAGKMDSLQAFRAIGNLTFDQVEALWNQEPFDTFFYDQEKMPYHAKSQNGVETITAGSGYKEYPINEYLRVGAIQFYHYKVDPSVRTLTFLNGLVTNISRVKTESEPRDEIYRQENRSDEDVYGVEVITLVKMDGLDEPWRAINAGRQDFCQDWSRQRVSEVLVIMVNQDLDNWTRSISSEGEDTRIIATSTPCMKLTGKAKKIYTFDGVTQTTEAEGLEFIMPGFDPSMDPRMNLLMAESIPMYLVKGSLTWKIEGADSLGCIYTGSTNTSITEKNNSYLKLFHSYLPGSLHFLGYEGIGMADYDAEVTYSASCPGEGTQEWTDPVGVFFMPDGTIPIKPGGKLEGSLTIDGGGGVTTTFEWDLTPGGR